MPLGACDRRFVGRHPTGKNTLEGQGLQELLYDQSRPPQEDNPTL